MMQPQQRPTGITILAVLAGIGGVLMLLAGLAGLGGGAVASGSGGGMLAILGVIALVLAALYLAFAYGAWTLKPWAWTLGIAGQAIGIILSIVYIIQGATIGSQIVSILIGAGIIYYLMTPEIKRAFGRA